VGFYNDDGCMHGAAGGIPQLGSCVSEPSSTTINYSNKSVNASCSAATVQKTAAPSQWSQTLNVCGGAVQQGTCAASDEICVQNPAQAFAAKYCITSSASQACPAAYPAQSQMFPSYKDLRECPSSCSCTPSGQDCEMQVDVYAQASCVGTKTTKHVTSASDICLISNTASQNSYFPQLVVSNAGTCSFSGALIATGSVAGENPTTVCCTQ